MKIYHDLEQGSPEWLDVRRRNFTASELGPWALEPVKINLTVEEIKTRLDLWGISRKGVTKRDELLAMLPEPETHFELCDGARTAILSKIKQEVMLNRQAIPADQLTEENQLWLAREEEIAAKDAKSFEYNIPVKYGKLLEPYAREFYERKTGFVVTEVGFVEHDSTGFGCSPDGLVSTHGDLNRCNPSSAAINATHGLEIKCPTPETHAAWLLAGTLPECHKLQVHACLATTGLDTWHFLSYCPGDAPLLLTVKRDEFTDRLEAGLKTLVAEKAKIKARLRDLTKEWLAEYGKVGA